MPVEPELTFEMLFSQKKRHGFCVRCFEKPVGGRLKIKAFDADEPVTRQMQRASSLCLECLEFMYRSLAASLAQPVIFGEVCPRCQKERPVRGRVVLTAEKLISQNNRSPKYKSLVTSTYKYCESCTVYSYRNVTSLHDDMLEKARNYLVKS